MWPDGPGQGRIVGALGPEAPLLYNTDDPWIPGLARSSGPLPELRHWARGRP